MQPQQWRYFLGFLPDAALAQRILALGDALGLADDAIIDHLHLTLCTIAELDTRDETLADRLDPIITAARLESCRIRLGRARSGNRGAVIRSIGSQNEISLLYQKLPPLLRRLDLAALHRKNGLSTPHITLSYKGGPAQILVVPFEWIPTELCLVESWVGCTRHEILRRWPLLPPPQGELDWGAGGGDNFTHRLRQERTAHAG